ncbi:MAG: hypothetical protein AB1499_05535 [Nitrospirota bacterium]
MRNYLSFVLCFIIVVLSPAGVSYASDITLNGSVYFTCNFVSTYMEKHGYVLVEKDINFFNLKLDRYVAQDARVIIKDRGNIVLGSGKTDINGNFSIPVPEKLIYSLVIRFHGRDFEKTVPYSEAMNISADLGYFDTETVGSWITLPPLYYCYTCNIRYLETKKSF